MEICPEEMHALATMAKMEKTCPKVWRIFLRGSKERVAILAKKGIFGEHSPKSYQTFK